MTRHKHAQTGLVTPQLPQLLLTAVLRMLAMLVLHVASTFRMKARRVAVIGTQLMPLNLPERTTDTQHKETNPAVQPDSPIALILSSTQSVRLSKDEGVLVTASYKLPQHREHNQPAPPHLRSSRRKSGPRAPRVMLTTGVHQQPWNPACAGMSGDALTASNKNAAT